jgi:hypothetical protein
VRRSTLLYVAEIGKPDPRFFYDRGIRFPDRTVAGPRSNARTPSRPGSPLL